MEFSWFESAKGAKCNSLGQRFRRRIRQTVGALKARNETSELVLPELRLRLHHAPSALPESVLSSSWGAAPGCYISRRRRSQTIIRVTPKPFHLFARASFSLIRVRTSFFTSVAGKGLLVGNRIVPLDVLYDLSSSSCALIGAAPGKKLQWSLNAAYDTSIRPSNLNVGIW